MTIQTTTPVLRDGYIQWVIPATARATELYKMLGDHGNFCPVKFEVRNDFV